jgi:hypothetical protein
VLVTTNVIWFSLIYRILLPFLEIGKYLLRYGSCFSSELKQPRRSIQGGHSTVQYSTVQYTTLQYTTLDYQYTDIDGTRRDLCARALALFSDRGSGGSLVENKLCTRTPAATGYADDQHGQKCSHPPQNQHLLFYIQACSIFSVTSHGYVVRNRERFQTYE